ncbi:2-oxoglutarate dehydrogenase complex dihydrolipoyllysine-residue succinyltransferase [Terasakiella sp. A23]|uniref:2-oxoglutarate dehydrogenase complex dihydrolipoyllysine-residue succinyltransferase n=1 Tax=Terasakiella sp. FCG-A23 TaxID=3080561 RepID=UPI00295365A7|nr:2-oxoglutarate dehydrogenase complex dihydrolipoyllysine-residue succinyltransferase [Terasakiella sp. A23]MDV7338079.1 2-oxoglutarate dehydrogenase complex dihydrolipoyllysine-residue succinyltransferase [Terasakiella sp. A23]
MATEITVPALGESVSEGTVSKWLKNIGDTVAVDEPLVELETDKVTVEVPSPVAGTLVEIVAGDDTDVEVGAVLCMVGEAGEAAAPVAPAAAAPAAEAAAPATSSGTGEVVDIVVPNLGESITEGTVASWLKAVGDEVAVDEGLCEVETDKVTAELPSPVAGVVTEIIVAEDTDVEVGQVVARVAVGASAGAVAPAAAAPAAAASAPAAAAANTAHPLSPAVGKLVNDNGLDASKIPATGKDGRLVKGDVLAYIKSGQADKDKAAAAAPAPAAPAPKAAAPAPAAAAPASSTPNGAMIPPRPEGPREERVKMTRLRKVIASRLKEAQNTAAILTTWNEVDMTGVLEMRKQYKDGFEKKHGVKLGFMGIFTKACVTALREWPAVNAEIDGDDIVYKNHYDVGIAVGSPTGLVVPVVRDCDEKSLAQIEGDIVDFGKRARSGELKMDEMMGGTFTISNGGVFGSLLSAPILNRPQSAILGMHKTQMRPMVMPDGSIQARPMMYLALSYDHRIIDGREAVSFLVRVKECLEDPQRILLDA